MFCTQCGVERKSGQRFCASCGAKLSEAATDLAAGAQSTPAESPKPNDDSAESGASKASEKPIDASAGDKAPDPAPPIQCRDCGMYNPPDATSCAYCARTVAPPISREIIPLEPLTANQWRGVVLAAAGILVVTVAIFALIIAGGARAPQDAQQAVQPSAAPVTPTIATPSHSAVAARASHPRHNERAAFLKWWWRESLYIGMANNELQDAGAFAREGRDPHQALRLAKSAASEAWWAAGTGTPGRRARRLANDLKAEAVDFGAAFDAGSGSAALEGDEVATPRDAAALKRAIRAHYQALGGTGRVPSGL